MILARRYGVQCLKCITTVPFMYAEIQTNTVNETVRKRLRISFCICKKSKNMHSNCAFTGHKLCNPSKAYRSHTKVTKVVGVCERSTVLLLFTHIFAPFRGGRGFARNLWGVQKGVAFRSKTVRCVRFSSLWFGGTRFMLSFVGTRHTEHTMLPISMG